MALNKGRIKLLASSVYELQSALDLKLGELILELEEEPHSFTAEYRRLFDVYSDLCDFKGEKQLLKIYNKIKKLV